MAERGRRRAQRHRLPAHGAQRPPVVCVCNFTPVRYDDFVIGLPKRGVLRELLSSDSEEFGGSGVHSAPEIRSEDVPFGALPCSARVTLPPLSTVYFTFTNR